LSNEEKGKPSAFVGRGDLSLINNTKRLKKNREQLEERGGKARGEGVEQGKRSCED